MRVSMLKLSTCQVSELWVERIKGNVFRKLQNKRPMPFEFLLFVCLVIGGGHFHIFQAFFVRFLVKKIGIKHSYQETFFKGLSDHS